MLIAHYELDVFTPPPEAEAEKLTAIARLTTDISEVLPYLNATWYGAQYQRAANALTWKKGGHHLTLHAHQIAIGNVEGYDVAVGEIDELVTLINRTWDRRAEITPDYETRQRPPVMTVYKLLPRTNCQQCGEPTCYAFAIKLTAAQTTLAACAPMLQPHQAAKLSALRALVNEVPASNSDL